MLLFLLPATGYQAKAAYPLQQSQPASQVQPDLTEQPVRLEEQQKTTKLERWALKMQHQSRTYQRAAVNGFAIGALAGAGIGVLGFIFVEGWILGIGAVAAIALGIVGISGHRKNKWLAWTGLILGIIELLFLIAVLALIATL